MSTVILLTAAQATQISGPSKEAPSLAALQPIGLTDGRFILGVEVLTDPMHAEFWPLLSALPQADYQSVAGLVVVAGPT